VWLCVCDAGIIPVDEFFDAVGSRYCMVFSDRERRLLRKHLDKDNDGTIDYKEVSAENR
jgi:Ca2+-binding EF-hand superfamily protein